MTQYLVAVEIPVDYAPNEAENALIQHDVDVLNEELKAAGAMVFGGGLSQVHTATVLRAQENGDVLVTDGPFLETKEQIGGFWVIEAADLDAALGWGRKAARACRVPIEVRPFEGVVE
ncbi:YciI family protein [Jongsikchunia kroppenstedtii]|uniref:YciI family protein n=1 Tax=Jongsikchunia kroppenstedtii TaxID=1121721 RepID=UPI000376042E|nr:YciI family protein [Jongsikchunia kroppenstedtii]